MEALLGIYCYSKLGWWVWTVFSWGLGALAGIMLRGYVRDLKRGWSDDAPKGGQHRADSPPVYVEPCGCRYDTQTGKYAHRCAAHR